MPPKKLRLQRGETALSVRLFRVAGCLNVCLLWLALLSTVSDGQTLSRTDPKDLLGMDPGAFAQWLHTARPTPVSAEEKARIVGSLPPEGEVTDLKAGDLTKLAGLKRVLQLMDRDSVYLVKIIDAPQAGVGLHARSVVLISKTALDLLNTDELQAFAAHEIGHEYVWDEYTRAAERGDRKRLKELELMCDAIAIVTLDRLGVDSSSLISGIEKITRFNRNRLGTALNERNYPTVAERHAFARSIRAWLTRGAPVSEDREWPNLHIEDPYTRDSARRALHGASLWLAAPKCQSLFFEFRDDRGLPLATKLQELDADPQRYVRMVLFQDGTSQPPCKRHGVLAFTARGNRVVYLCGRDFERAWRRDAREAQATIIHEVLHSLGLGENPPSPRRITDRVQSLCWQ